MAEAVPGMVLARCVVDSNGKIVLSDGVVLTEKYNPPPGHLGYWRIIYCG